MDCSTKPRSVSKKLPRIQRAARSSASAQSRIAVSCRRFTVGKPLPHGRPSPTSVAIDPLFASRCAPRAKDRSQPLPRCSKCSVPHRGYASAPEPSSICTLVNTVLGMGTSVTFTWPPRSPRFVSYPLIEAGSAIGLIRSRLIASFGCCKALPRTPRGATRSQHHVCLCGGNRSLSTITPHRMSIDTTRTTDRLLETHIRRRHGRHQG